MNLNKWFSFFLMQLVSMTMFATASSAEELINRQDKVWQPGAEATQISIWPKEPPPPSPFSGMEAYGNENTRIAGRPYTMIEHVSQPTMTIFHPKGQGTGTTIMVFPGGGYQKLAIDLEGTEICDWLTGKGITCVILKYRVPGSGPNWSEECNCRRIPAQPYALQDAQRAMGLLRERAAEFGIDPRRIGVLGFSAGGHLVAEISNRRTRSYQAVDAADRQSSRPDFAIAVYPGHLWQQPRLTLNPAIRIASHAPPTLIIAASDDPVDDVRHSLVYYIALQQAHIPVEMHLYARGGHAFGVRETSNTSKYWPKAAEDWMRSLALLGK
jgi:acetyl esterase/lipase